MQALWFGPVKEKAVIEVEVKSGYFLGEHHFAFRIADRARLEQDTHKTTTSSFCVSVLSLRANHQSMSIAEECIERCIMDCNMCWPIPSDPAQDAGGCQLFS